MTRSEVVEMLVDEAMLNCERFASLGDFDGSEIERAMLNTELEILLAEQKRSEGCDLCLFDDGTKVTHLVLAETCEGDANYCPRCGRDLTEGESV